MGRLSLQHRQDSTRPASVDVRRSVDPSPADDLQRLWIVVHGFGRGRSSPFPGVFLNHLAARGDPLLACIRLHNTGEPTPAIGGGDVVLFWLGDPLQQLYPDCYEEAVAIERSARSAGARVLNPPDALSRTSKLAQSALWQAGGTPSARGWGFASYKALVEALPELPTPLIVRYDYGHSQQHMVLGETAEATRRQAEKLRFPIVALEFINTRPSGGGASVYCRMHHKKRAFVFCDVVVNSHVFFSKEPLVSQATCTFAAQARWRGRLARACGLGRGLLEETVSADRSFFDSPPEAPETLIAAAQTLGLDIAAIDYATSLDGVVLWEANPYFFLPHGSRSLLARERDAVRRVDATWDAMADALRRVLHPGCEEAPLRERASA